jgi:uncharacterized membrane protein YbaN (DUF454 family)
MLKHKSKVIATGLIILGISMIYLGQTAGILPPTLTGVGFLLLAWHVI